MATILFRIFLLYKLLNVFFLYLVPKKLRIYLPSSWYQSHHHIHKQVTDLPSPRIPRRMDTDELKLCFQMFDRNGDGQISKQELNDSLEKIGIFISDNDLTQMIEKVDANGDGSVNIDEFRDLYGTIMQERDHEEEEDMKEAFNVFDRNGDGFISADELKSVLESLGLKNGKIGEDCTKMMISKVDVDGDGMVDFNEFKEMMKSGRAFAS